MTRLLCSFALICFLAYTASSQEPVRFPRPETTAAQSAPHIFATKIDRLREAFNAGRESELIALESDVLGAMREELERSEAGGRTQFNRQKAIFAEFEHFSFYRAQPADAQARFLLLEEFANTMK